ncbi:MAG: ABC transporter ATP-binding protein [Anaerolineae bacterium]
MLRLRNISHRYQEELVLDTVNLQVNSGEIVCLLGESGSGKTTLLRVIAGIEQGYEGSVVIDGEAIDTMPVHRRGFGLMFQDFALFPHMNVTQNISFGLRMQGMREKDQETRIMEMLELVGLDGYEERSVDALSGGQKQRVALARSLAPQPRLLMLDEPLGSLDASLRERLVLELHQIIKQIGLTTIYVTHDQQEAYAIADQIAVIHAGRIEQYDTPQNLYLRPKNRFVAEFLGLSNIVSIDFLSRYVQLSERAEYYLLHPSSLSVHPDGVLDATVSECVFQGDHYRLTVKVDGITLRLNTPSTTPLSDTSNVKLHVDDSAIHPIQN